MANNDSHFPHPIRGNGGTTQFTALTTEQANTLEHLTFNELTDQLEADRSIETVAQDGILLGDKFTFTSGGEQIFFKNQSSGISFYPLLGGIKDQSVLVNQDATGLIQPFMRVLGNDLDEKEPLGVADISGAVDWELAITVAVSASAYGLEFIIEEPISFSDFLVYQLFEGIDASGKQIFEQLRTGFIHNPTDFVKVDFDSPVDRVKDQQLFGRMLKRVGGRDGTASIVQARRATNTSTAPYVKFFSRTFLDNLVADHKYVHKMLLGQSLGDLFTGEVEFHADLPDVIASAGQIWRVMKRTANYWMLGMTSRHLAGYYESDGTNWILRPNAAMPTFDIAQGDDSTTTNYRHFTPADIAGLGGTGLPDRIVSTDTLNTLIITDNLLTYDANGVTKLQFASTESRLFSPDGTNYYEIKDTGALVWLNNTARLDITETGTFLASANSIWTQEVSTTEFSASHISNKRLLLTPSESSLLSPDGTWQHKISNTDFLVKDGTTNRLLLDSASSRIYSPDSTADYMRIDPTVMGFTMSGKSRVLIATGKSQLLSASGAGCIDVRNASLSVDVDSEQRMQMDATSTKLWSPGQLIFAEISNTKFSVTHSSVERLLFDGFINRIIAPDGLTTLIMVDSILTFADATRTRFSVNQTQSFISSPNGLEILEVNDAGAFYNSSEILTFSDEGVRIPSLVDGVIPEAQLPSFVDDVIEGFLDIGDTQLNGIDSFYVEAAFTTLITPAASKIYIDRNFNTSYRFTGTVYVQISSGLVIGELIGNAYRGDRGKIAFDHSEEPHDFAATAHAHNVVQSPDALKALTITDTSFIYNDGADRLIIDAIGSTLLSSDGSQNVTVDNAGAFYGGAEIATVADVAAAGGGAGITAPDDTAIAFWDAVTSKLITHPNATIDASGGINGSFFPTDGASVSGVAQIHTDPQFGLVIEAGTGAQTDFMLKSRTGSALWTIAPGASTVEMKFPVIFSVPGLDLNTDVGLGGSFGKDESLAGITDTSVPRTVTLETNGMFPGRMLRVQDQSGGASINNITIDTQNTAKINGVDTLAIDTDYGGFDLYSDGTDWFTSPLAVGGGGGAGGTGGSGTELQLEELRQTAVHIANFSSLTGPNNIVKILNLPTFTAVLTGVYEFTISAKVFGLNTNDIANQFWLGLFIDDIRDTGLIGRYIGVGANSADGWTLNGTIIRTLNAGQIVDFGFSHDTVDDSSFIIDMHVICKQLPKKDGGDGVDIISPAIDKGVAFWDTTTGKLKTHPNLKVNALGELEGVIRPGLGPVGINNAIMNTPADGLTVIGSNGTNNDINIFNRSNQSVMKVPIGTKDAVFGAAITAAKAIIKGPNPGTVGGHSSGQLQVQSSGTGSNDSASITGHNSFGGNTQLWFLGSSSGGNQDVTLLNRRNATLNLGTNNSTKMTISSDTFGRSVTLNNFTALGAGNAFIKIKRLTGTTSTSTAGNVGISHGLNAGTIISATILVDSKQGDLIPDNYQAASNFRYQMFITSVQVKVVNFSGNSSNITGRPIKITLIYVP